MKALYDVDEVRPREQSDQACFDELRDVLKKHNAVDRFGITLLHQHFDIADDEILLEETDVENRIQRIRPVKRSEVDLCPSLQTQWRLDVDQSIQECTQCCTMDPDDHSHTSTTHL